MSLFRRNPVVRRRADGRYDVVLAEPLREVVDGLLGELDDLLDGGPDDPALRRLSPPAYLDDDDREVEYQLLAGDELRSSRRAAVDAMRTSLGEGVVGEDELWQWLQTLNALRLVVGTRLGIDDDDGERLEVGPDDPLAPLWQVYELGTWLQHAVVDALDG